MSSIENDIEQSFIQGNNIYISGVGGTGKSFLLKKIFQKYSSGWKQEKPEDCPVCLEKIGDTDILACGHYVHTSCISKSEKPLCPICKHDTRIPKKVSYLTSTTGISAYNIGGRTIHNWAGFICPNNDEMDDPQKVIDRCIKKVRTDWVKANRWRTTSVLFIDEISMLGGTFLDLLNAVARIVRKNNKPFGGIQVVCTGDMLQLPLVKDYYPFEVEAWNLMKFKCFNLTTCHRFDDDSYIELLKRARVGKLCELDVKILKSRVARPADDIIPTMLLSKNRDVYEKNRNELDKLPGESIIIKCSDYVLNEKGERIDDKIPPEIEENFNCDKILYIKEKSQVMLTINMDVESGLVNGSRGIITSIQRSNFDNSIVVYVKFKNGMHVPISEHAFAFEDDGVSYVRKTLPIKLCWCASIHKSQGLTLDCIYTDLGQDIFCPGQAYVALSRCRNLNGLYIKSFHPSKVFANKTALEFEKTLNKK